MPKPILLTASAVLVFFLATAASLVFLPSALSMPFAAWLLALVVLGWSVARRVPVSERRRHVFGSRWVSWHPMSRSSAARIERVVQYRGGIDLCLSSHVKLPDFRPGQTATLALGDGLRGAASVIVAGGDDTSRRVVARDHLVSQNVIGRMLTRDPSRIGRSFGKGWPGLAKGQEAQLWVAGGAGIAFFFSRLETMSPKSAPCIHLIFCVRSEEAAPAVAEIERHMQRLPQVRFTLATAESGQHMRFMDFVDTVKALPEHAQIYVAGDSALTNLVRKTWKSVGQNRAAQAFHQITL